MESFSLKNLSFYYGKKIILNNISFSIKKGDIIALVGNNGVGKTTLLKILAKQIKHKQINHNYNVSFLINKPCFYPYMTGYQNLHYFALNIKNKLFTEKEVLELVDLYRDQNLKYHKYSLGMKQKLGIAKCLLDDADLYVFDEPLNGLDFKGICMFRDIISLLKSLNKTVIISSHILNELNLYCNKVFYINDKHYFLEYNLQSNMPSIETIFLNGQVINHETS